MGVPTLFFEYFCGQIISHVCPTKKEQVRFDERCRRPASGQKYHKGMDSEHGLRRASETTEDKRKVGLSRTCPAPTTKRRLNV